MLMWVPQSLKITLFKDSLYFESCVCVCLCAGARACAGGMYTMNAGVCGGQSGQGISLELLGAHELPNIGARNQTQVLCRSSKNSEQLSHLVSS